MSQPTTSVAFSGTTPAAQAGRALATPQSDNGTPQQIISFEIPNDWGVAVKTADYTLQATDCGLLVVMNSASAHTFKLPASGSPVAPPFAQWKVLLANIGAGTVTIDPNGLQLDGSAATITIATGQGLEIRTDASNYFSSRGVGGSGGSMVYPAAGVPQSTGSAWGASLTLDTDGALAANSDTRLATQKATKTYADGKIAGAGTVVSGDFALFSGTSGKALQDTGISPTTDGTLAGNSDSLIPTEKAVKTYVDTKVAGVGSPNFVDAEKVSGSGTSFTLAHTPAAGCEPILIQRLPSFGGVHLLPLSGSPAIGDYSRSGTAITTTNSITAGTLFAWYRY